MNLCKYSRSRVLHTLLDSSYSASRRGDRVKQDDHATRVRDYRRAVGGAPGGGDLVEEGDRDAGKIASGGREDF